MAEILVQHFPCIKPALLSCRTTICSILLWWFFFFCRALSECWWSCSPCRAIPEHLGFITARLEPVRLRADSLQEQSSVCAGEEGSMELPAPRGNARVWVRTISRLIPAALLRACAVMSGGHAAGVGGFGHLCHSSLPPVPTLDSMILMGPFQVGILDVCVILCSHSAPDLDALAAGDPWCAASQWPSRCEWKGVK